METTNTTSACTHKTTPFLNAELICHICNDAVIFVSVALLKSNTCASLFTAFVGYTRDVIHVLPPCAKLSTIE